MTWTYGNDPGTGTAAQRRDAVRLSIGDTNTLDQQLSDEEIAYFLVNHSDDIPATSLSAVDALIAKLALAAIDTSIGKTSISLSKRMDHFKTLRNEILLKSVTAGAEWFAGGLTKSGKDSLASDSDAIQPHFSSGMDDNLSNQSDTDTSD